MLAPNEIQFLCVGCSEAHLTDFYMAEDLIFNNFGIKFKVKENGLAFQRVYSAPFLIRFNQ